MQITIAAPEERPAAFELALRHLGADIRATRALNALTLVAAGDIDPDGIIVARAGSRLCGVLVCVPLPGASGLFWLPKTDPVDAALEERLVQHGLEWLRGGGAKIAQAIIDPRDAEFVGPLRQRGFRLVTRLQYLEHPLDRLPLPTATSLSYNTYSEETQEAFHTTLLRTYEGTLDCPELNGVRTIDEIIAGHIGQGRFRPECWRLAFDRGGPIGVAMAAEVPESAAWDLAYLGVVPEARRRGYGRELAASMLREALDAQASKLIVAVDERNQPALQLYHELGFLSADVREVYLHFFRSALAAESSQARPRANT
jgi:ribosomal protein S18 acetylase RimI-like enzyme